MKRIRFILLLLAATIGLNAQAQTFSKLSEKQRTEKLTKIARNVYRHPMLKKYHDTYGENGKFEITSYKIDAKDVDQTKIGGKNLGRLQYVVYLYSKNGCMGVDGPFRIVRVYISDTAGKAWRVTMGCDNITYDYSVTKELFK